MDRIDGAYGERVAGPRSDRLTDDRPLHTLAAVADSGCAPPPFHLNVPPLRRAFVPVDRIDLEVEKVVPFTTGLFQG